MYYAAIDKWNNGDSLAHYKYIKKIKIGPFTRYFYSMSDLRNYYKTLNNSYSEKDMNKLGVSTKALKKKEEKLNAPLTRLKYAFRFGPTEKVSSKKYGSEENGYITVDTYRNRTYKEDKEKLEDEKRYSKFVRRGIVVDNSHKAKLNTGAFFLKNLFGSSSKKSLEKRYKKQLKADTKKHKTQSRGYYDLVDLKNESKKKR